MARRSKSPLDSGPVKSDLGPETRPARHGRSGLAPPLPHAPRLAPPSSTAGRASPGRGKHLSQPDSLLPARAAHEERLSADLRAALRREAALTKELEALRDAFERLQAELSEARQAAYGLPLLQVEEALVMRTQALDVSVAALRANESLLFTATHLLGQQAVQSSQSEADYE